MHLTESLQNDMRSIINNLQLLSNQHENKTIDYNTAKNEYVFFFILIYLHLFLKYIFLHL